MAKTEVSYLEKIIHSFMGEKEVAIAPQPEASSGVYRTLGSSGFNGEKNAGEIGPVINYWIDYETLRARSWQLLLESEVAYTVIKRHIEWVIGTGLKLQAEPVVEVIEEAGIKIDRESFSKQVEARFRLFCKSRMSDYSDMESFDQKQSDIFKAAIVGGDCLVILRLVKNVVKVEVVDGCHVQSPPGVSGNEYWPTTLENGNRIIHGIEVDKKGMHVAYYVRESPYTSLKYTRIKARATDGDGLMAFMVYGTKYRLDSYRGMPLLSVLFETAKQMDRYKGAVIGSAEERQKIAFAIEHDIFSTGENPLLKQTVQARNIGLGISDNLVPRDDFGNALADKIAVTTKKGTYNLPLGAHLKSLESKNELYFKDFMEMNIMLFCAAAGCPYEVAMAMYNSNYSASRAALKQWEHILKVLRNSHSFQVNQPVYDFFLEVEILLGNINAPGYINARFRGDRLLMEAFRNARFTGPAIPHIDPEKEVKAERLKLGVAGAAIPLTTAEAATEALSEGDYNTNLDQYAKELADSISKGVKMPEKEIKPPATS